MHAPICCSVAQRVSERFIFSVAQKDVSCKRTPQQLMNFSVYHASSTFGEQVPNTRNLEKPILYTKKMISELLPQMNSAGASVIIKLGQTAQQAAFYLRRLGPGGSCPGAG